MRKKIAEGFGPAYDKKGRILPNFRGLGPELEKDIKLKYMPSTPKPKPKKEYWPRNIRHLA